MISIIGLYALCATSFTICKSLLLYVKPLFFIGVRMLLAGFIMTGWCWATNKKSLRFAKKDWWLIAQVMFFHVYFAYIFDVWALQYISSFKSSLFFNLSPFIAALISYFVFSERLSFKKAVGLGIGCLGILPQLSCLQGNDYYVALPDIVMLGAVTSSVYGWILVKKLMNNGYSILSVNGIGMIGGGALALGTSFFVEGVSESPVFDFWPFAKLLLLIIFVINILFYNFYGALLKRYSATMLSFAGFITPLFAALYGWIFLGELVTWEFFFSLTVVSLGLFIFYQEELRQPITVTH
jgi:drug/metabolite transporter (DMT)-like permease